MTERLAYPSLPFDLHPPKYPEGWETRVKELWDEVCLEILDPEYLSMQHYKRHTYDSGCRGPLCLKFVRDSSRSRPRSNGSYKPRPDRAYDPVIDYYKIVALKKLDEQRQQLINERQGA